MGNTLQEVPEFPLSLDSFHYPLFINGLYSCFRQFIREIGAIGIITKFAYLVYVA